MKINMNNPDSTDEWGWFVDLENSAFSQGQIKKTPHIKILETILDYDDEYEYYIQNQTDCEDGIIHNNNKFIVNIFNTNFICNILFQLIKIFQLKYCK